MREHRAWARWAVLLVGLTAVPVPGCLRRSVDVAATPLPAYEVWAYWFGDASQVAGVDLDERGRVAIAGTVLDTTGVDERLARARGTWRGRVSVLGPAGGLEWSAVASGRSGMALVRNAPDGGVVATGLFEEEVDMGCGPIYAENGGVANFVVKLDADGRCRWSRRLPGYAMPEGLAVDPGGDVYVVGAVDLPGPERTSRGFVVRYDAAGSVRWERQPVPGALVYVGVVADGDRVAFLAMPGPTNGDDSRHRAQVLVLLDGDGALRWRHELGRESDVGAGGLALDEDGALFVGGWFAHRLALGDDRLVARHGRDAFLARFEHDGTLTWSLAFEDESDVFAAPTHLGSGGDLRARVMRLRPDAGGDAPVQPAVVLLTLDADGRILEVSDVDVPLCPRCTLSLAGRETDLVVGVTARVDRPCEVDTWPEGEGGVIRYRLGR